MIPATLSPFDSTFQFPNPELALTTPNGLLAIGGDLQPSRILNAYRQGIFPWFSDDQPILWWSPDPRMILKPEELTTSRSLRKTLRKNEFHWTFDQAFTQVIFSCAQPREKQAETWITACMMDAYINLHKLGHAHSFETWQDGQLVGGLYGITIGQVFFGESMFSQKTNASKVAFVKAVEQLTAWGYKIIDCQIESKHLESFGATNVSRSDFLQQITHFTTCQPEKSAWQKEQLHNTETE